jgi:exodeoxyribonuclease V alpha subunit
MTLRAPVICSPASPRISRGAYPLSTDLFSRSSGATLEGTLERLVFNNPASGWSVARLLVEGIAQPVTIVGNLAGVRPGERLQLHGTWEEDRRYGRQFRVTSFRSTHPSTLEGIRKYLGSGLVSGVGPVTAERIVEKFGGDTLRVLEDEPQRLREVPGLGRKRAAAIRKAWREQRDIKDVMVFLQRHDIGTAHALRIFRTYGARSIATVTENPYRLAHDVVGIGFRSADRIAKALGLEADAPRRVEAGVRHVLEQALNEGHCFLPRRRLLARAVKLLHPGQLDRDPEPVQTQRVAPEQVDAAIDRLLAREHLAAEPSLESTPLYTRRIRDMEMECARALVRLRGAGSVGAIDARRAIVSFERREGLQLSEGQREAVERALVSRVLVITGGPGTGKTTLVRALIRILGRRQRVVLAAPTGRAARRLAEAAGREAVTLHRLLEWSPHQHRFQRDASAPLDADVFVVDETSMVDLPLMHHLLQAIRSGARLLLVGDVDQLPSVGPGAVLADIIDSDVVDCVRLSEIFRQDERGLIVHNAHLIRRGEPPRIPPAGERADFVFVERRRPEEILDSVSLLVCERLPQALRVDPRRDVQVLSPMNRGNLGTVTLNLELQRLLNPNGEPLGTTGMRVGDKVMQVRNNYTLEVFNGDIGRVEAVDENEQAASVRFDNRSLRYGFADLDELSLAYACTVHKSQGSEYPVVLLVLHSQHHLMLQRNLLYTAVTRARQQIVVVGERRALSTALRNDRGLERNTLLAERLRRLADQVDRR